MRAPMCFDRNPATNLPLLHGGKSACLKLPCSPQKIFPASLPHRVDVSLWPCAAESSLNGGAL